MTSFYPEGSNVRFVVGCLRVPARDWWKEVNFTLGSKTIEAMTWMDFVTWFQVEFPPTLEVQQLVRKFLDIRQTTETVAEITANFRERSLLVP